MTKLPQLVHYVSLQKSFRDRKRSKSRNAQRWLRSVEAWALADTMGPSEAGSLVGRKLAKLFAQVGTDHAGQDVVTAHKWYVGECQEWLEDKQAYSVLYEDGDTEEIQARLIAFRWGMRAAAFFNGRVSS